MNELLSSAIQSVMQSEGAFCRFITANDTHASGSHQAGFLMPIAAYPMIFNQEKIKGENPHHRIRGSSRKCGRLVHQQWFAVHDQFGLPSSGIA